MIFAARGLLVSLAFFATVYCPLSLLVVLTWQGVKHMSQATAAKNANLLFGLRIFPFAISAVVTVFFTFPSFWLLERRSLDEDAETFILALCSLIILGAGLLRVLWIQARTRRAVSRWSVQTSVRTSVRTASPSGEAGTPVLSASHGAPALIVVGVRKPRVMVSDTAAIVLSNDELQVALRHELGHVRSRDNLKKVLISAIPFPAMGGIERAWQEAGELAADEAAVATRQQALDLAAALIKLSRSSQPWPKPLSAIGLVSSSSSINRRVRHLLQWRTPERRFPHTRPWTLLILFTIIVGIASNYGATLTLTHRLTELLVP
jgi:Zn-dependent protease with chaperone function